VNIVGLKETYVRTPEQFVDVLVSWQNNRTVASTAANDRSSRSHTIFRIIVESRPSTVVSMQVHKAETAGRGILCTIIYIAPVRLLYMESLCICAAPLMFMSSYDRAP